MSLSSSVATATDNTSRLGYKHVCVSYLHLASHVYQYQEVIRHTDTHTRSLTHIIILFFLAQLHLSFNTNSSGEWKFQILLNQKRKSQACHKQTKEGVRRHKGSKSKYSQVNFTWLSHSLIIYHKQQLSQHKIVLFLFPPHFQLEFKWRMKVPNITESKT